MADNDADPADDDRELADDDIPDPDSPALGPSDRSRSEALRRTVLRKSIRRARARRRPEDSIWAWLGTFGLVGWTVIVPTLVGLAFGLFLDDRIDSAVSFTITFLVLGAAVGVSMAWYWVRQESQGDDER